MAKDILQNFEDFRNLEVNYSNPNFQSEYRDVLKQENFENALSYDDWRKDANELKRQEVKGTLEGAFHLVLNVKVDEESEFFPFAYVANTDPSKKDAAQAIIKARQSDIKYNFSQLLDNLTTARKGVAVESIAFKTTFDSGTLCLVKKGVKIDDRRASVKQFSIIGDCLKSKDSFISILSTEYHNRGIADNLYYNILSFDFDAKSGKKLTQFLLISENSEECYYFTQVRVRALRDIVSIIRTRYISDIAGKNQYESLKSAVAAIMSRNMSHNLGSHYLYYTKSYLEDLAASSGRIGPDIKGAAKVLGYMQARMDYLATIISNDKYPNGAVNFKSQIYDELTVDDFSKRHFRDVKDRCKRTTNFLLANLVLSEKFTRPNIFTSDSLLSDDKHYHGDFKSIRLQVKLWNADTNRFDTFTGSSKSGAIKRENNVKNELSKLNIALPGGTMSCHAFFNIVENFIRNSAKYLQKDFKDDGLLFTIAISRSKSIDNAFDFVVYDNKGNAERVLPLVNEQLRNLSIIDEKGGIEKSSKGLKEMLFSAVWMRSSSYPEETFADIINRIQSANSGETKLSLIRNYCFEFIAVNNNGCVKKRRISPNDNLGIRFVLPEFCFSRDFNINSDESEKEIITKALAVSSDIVCFNIIPPVNRIQAPKYLSYFTRPYFNVNFDEIGFNAYVKKARVLSADITQARDVYKFKQILDKRFKEETGGDIDTICLDLGGKLDIKPRPEDHRKIVYFERHLSTKKDGFSKFSDFAYADSISGGNFTITLNSIVEGGLDARRCTFKTWFDKLFVLKIKESALTRITLIDERLYNSMISDGPKKEEEYAFKNIRVLNINLDKANNKKWGIGDIIEGNHFRDNSNRSHFLSIHLGLIEKVVKSEWGDVYGKDTALENKVSLFMEQLKSYFSREGESIFVSVHSGRGNFSKELEGPLATYPFISLAAIENAFGNSKYLLSQLFYNTVYIGKGVINE